MAKARKELTGEKKRKEKKEKFVSFIDQGLKVGEVSKLFKSNRLGKEGVQTLSGKALP